MALLVLLHLSCASGCAHPQFSASPQHVLDAPQQDGAGPEDVARLADGIVPKHYDVSLFLDPNQEYFFGRVTIAVDLLEPQDCVLLHAVDLDIDRVAVMDGQGRRHKVTLTTTAHDRVHDMIRVQVQPPMPAGMASLFVSYSAPFSKQMTGLYRTSVNERFVVQSQLQPQGARRMMPCFDEPRFRTPFNVVLTVPEDVVCVGNSQAVGHRDAGSQRKAWAFEATPPLPAELLGLVVGPLDVLSAAMPPSPQRPYPIDGRGYRTHLAAKDANVLAWAMARLGPLVDEVEAYVDMPYPFSKLDLVATPQQSFAAVGQASLITLQDWLLPGPAPSSSYLQRRAFEMTAAFGIAQQWFGAWMNHADWDDVWMSASLANWRGLRAAHHVRPGMQFDLEAQSDMAAAMAHDAYAAALPLQPTGPNQNDMPWANKATINPKGAALLTMFEHSTGKDPFREGIRDCLRHHAYQAISTETFVSAVALGAKADELQKDFATFLQQPGVPSVSFACEADADGRHAALRIKQEPYRPYGGQRVVATWNIPVCFRAGSQEDTKKPRMTCVHLREAEMRVPQKRCPDLFVANADGAGYYRSHFDDIFRPASVAAMNPQSMSPKEWFVALDDLGAALDARALDAEQVFESIARGIKHANPRIARKALAMLQKAYLQYVPPSMQAGAVERWRRLLAVAERSLVHQVKTVRDAALFVAPSGAAADLFCDQRDELTLLRHDITWLQATAAKDAATRANLSHAGATWLDAKEVQLGLAPAASSKKTASSDPSSLMAEDVALALMQACETFGEPFIRRLMALVAVASDGAVRKHVLVALAHTSVAAALPDVLALSVSESLRSEERLPLLRGLMAHQEAKKSIWPFVVANMKTLMNLVPLQAQAQLVNLAASLCLFAEDATKIIQDAVAPHIQDVLGGASALRLTLEQNEVCAQQVAAQKDDVLRYFISAEGSSEAP